MDVSSWIGKSDQFVVLPSHANESLRTLSMTFGRPPSIPQQYIELSLPEDIMQHPSQRESPTSVDLNFFRASIKLYQITASVLTGLFDNNVGLDPTELNNSRMTKVACQVLMLEGDLREWTQELPNKLKLVGQIRDLHAPTSEDAKREAKPRVILTLRYHNLNILLHRSMLAEALKMVKSAQAIESMPMSPASKAVFHSSLQSAFDSAVFIIDFVHFMMLDSADRRCLLGEWWFVLYYSKLVSCLKLQT